MKKLLLILAIVSPASADVVTNYTGPPDLPNGHWFRFESIIPIELTKNDGAILFGQATGVYYAEVEDARTENATISITGSVAGMGFSFTDAFVDGDWRGAILYPQQWFLFNGFAWRDFGDPHRDVPLHINGQELFGPTFASLAITPSGTTGEIAFDYSTDSGAIRRLRSVSSVPEPSAFLFIASVTILWTARARMLRSRPDVAMSTAA